MPLTGKRVGLLVFFRFYFSVSYLFQINKMRNEIEAIKEIQIQNYFSGHNAYKITNTTQNSYPAWSSPPFCFQQLKFVSPASWICRTLCGGGWGCTALLVSSKRRLIISFILLMTWQLRCSSIRLLSCNIPHSINHPQDEGKPPKRLDEDKR